MRSLFEMIYPVIEIEMMWRKNNKHTGIVNQHYDDKEVKSMKSVKKTMRSTVSFLLSLTMMLAVFVIPVYADEPEPENVTIHYYNENNWQSPYLYYYADNNNPVVWPGVAMTSDGDNWYSYTVSNFDEIRVIFSNNGSNQYPAQNEPGILISGEKWFKNGNLYSQDPDTYHVNVHYYNGSGWSSPYIY